MNESKFEWARQGYMRERLYNEWIASGHGKDANPSESYYAFVQDELEKARATASNSQSAPLNPTCSNSECGWSNKTGGCGLVRCCPGRK